MGGVLIDTSVLSALYHEDHCDHEKAKALTVEIEPDDIAFVSVITMAEIDYGVRLAEQHKSKHVADMRDRADKIREHARLDVTHHTGISYAKMKSALAQKTLKIKDGKKLPPFTEDWIDKATGRQLHVGENDLWICAQALERDFILLSLDKHFLNVAKAVPELRLRHPSML